MATNVVVVTTNSRFLFMAFWIFLGSLLKKKKLFVRLPFLLTQYHWNLRLLLR
jgi:hypothetical protein